MKAIFLNIEEISGVVHLPSSEFEKEDIAVGKLMITSSNQFSNNILLKREVPIMIEPIYQKMYYCEMLAHRMEFGFD